MNRYFCVYNTLSQLWFQRENILFPLAYSPFRIIEYLKIIPEEMNTVSNDKVFLFFTPSWGINLQV